jgi:tRNA U34 2-thiouridine synthase MnmA/TrmU
MNLTSRKVKALGLCSGGLDSIMSAIVLRKQGIDIEWITFETPFFSSVRARKAAAMIGVPLTVSQITRIYLEMLKNPPCGYGQHMNPCMDCHALMFRLAGDVMKKKGFDFLFSGEVLGQRPMSQTKSSLRYVEKHSGFKGYILRPLSAQKLPETIPEKEGWVNRETLLGISGRSRKAQIKLAKEFGVTDYPAPAGGCLLTDKGYSSRLKDLFEHQGTHTEGDFQLLKYGRHLRLGKDTKIIVGRTKDENENIVKYYNRDSDTILEAKKYPGPTVLIPFGVRTDYLTLAAAICAGYSKAPKNREVEVVAVSPRGHKTISVIGVPPEEVKKFLI